MSDPLSSQQRLEVIQQVNALTSPLFDQLVFALKPPNGIIPGNSAPQGSRSAALLEWVESPTGPGLGALEQTLDHVTVPKFGSLKTQPIRAKLLRRLKNDINIRLTNSLHYLIKIDLQMEEQRQRVGQPQLELVPEDPLEESIESSQSLVNREFQLFGKQEKSDTEQLEATQSLMSILERGDVQHRLLILGEPGAGKTTELVALAYDLLKRAEQDTLAPIPIIFELSSWQEGKSIEQWLVEQLKRTYSLKEEIGQQWIRDEQIFLLLDGLDELGLEPQRQCIKALNHFLQTQSYPYVAVCCRREEYEAGKSDLSQLRGAVYLRSLTDQQIQGYLKDLNRFSLWQNIESSPDLLELARQPLFLTMHVVAYQGKPIRNQSELFNAYIEKQLEDPSNQGTYPPSKTPSQFKTLHYLRWLAGQLEKAGKTEYLVEEMQPSWLLPARQRCLYRLLGGLMSGLMGGLLGGLMSGLVSGLLFGLSVGLLFGLLFGLMRGLMGGLMGGLSVGLLFGLSIGLLSGLRFGLSGGLTKTIKPSDRLAWSMDKGLSNGLIFGLLFGLFFGLLGGLSGGLSGGLILGLIYGLLFGLLGGLLGGLEKASLEEKSVPNQGIQKSFQNSLAVLLSSGLLGELSIGLLFGLSGGLIYGLRFGLILGLIFGLFFGLIYGLSGGLIYGLRFGLDAVIQHYALRFLLAQEGSFPWDCVRFLDHAAKLRFIQRVGGRYRFMHDLLRKHFANGELPSYPSR